MAAVAALYGRGWDDTLTAALACFLVTNQLELHEVQFVSFSFFVFELEFFQFSVCFLCSFLRVLIS